VRRILVGVLALGACAFAPATASAAPSLSSDPVSFKDYKLTLSLSKSGGQNTLSVIANRTAAGGKAVQTHMWSFPLSNKAVKLTAKGATIKTGTELGRYGSINMTIAAGKPKRTQLPCFVSAFVQRKGTLTGKLRLSLDGGYFKRVSKSSIPAGISAKFPELSPSCGGNGNGGGGQQTGTTQLSANVPGGVMLNAIRDAKGAVTHQATLIEPTETIAPATSVFHMINAQVGADGLQAAADSSSASLAFGSPFLVGSLTFTAMEGMATPQFAMGAVAGSLQVAFDSPGAQTLTAVDNASLMRS
jgi:hypothetical protein